MSTPHAPDPFGANLLTLPQLHQGKRATWQGFEFDEALENDTFHLPDAKEEHLPSLEAGFFELKLDDAPSISLDASSVSDYATADEDSQERSSRQVRTNTNDIEDVWALSAVSDTGNQATLTSWDHFLDPKHVEPGPAYLSEADPNVFDAVVQMVSLSTPPIKWLHPDRLIHDLYELALGRSSIFFVWNEQKSAFVQKAKSFTVTGFTPEIIAKVVEDVSSTGTMIKTLRLSQELAFQQPSSITFHAVIRSCLTAIEMHMDSQKPRIVSILSLQHIYEQPQTLLRILVELRDTIRHSPNEVSMLSRLLLNCKGLSIQYPRFTQTLNQILATMFAPALHHLGATIGLCPPTDGYHWGESRPFHLLEPGYLTEIVMEVQQSLDLVCNATPHRLLLTSPSDHENVLCLAFSWDKVSELQEAAMHYETAARAGVMRQTSGNTLQPVYMDQPTNSAVQRLEVSKFVQTQDEDPNLFRLDLNSSELLPADALQQLALASLQSDCGQPTGIVVPLDQMLELSASPLLFAQHRLLSYLILKLLVSEYHLSSHLRLLRQMHLFGNGVFATRLSTALFDDELASGEGGRRTGATTGLRLQTRDSWPPASSELRLVLMGILSDSLSSAGMKELDDRISFAIRDLSDDEMELCRDVDSVHALDFLKLQYKPKTTVLEAILSSESLDKYDRIFRHILRVLRLRCVAQGLLRGACRRGEAEDRKRDHKFRLEIQQFISVIAGYCQDIAISGPWSRMQGIVGIVESRLEAQDYDGTLQSGKSLEHLRQLHSGVLDDMLRALLLKQKETKALAALEEIFGVVLRFAAALRHDDDDMMETTTRLHDEFRKQVRRFVDQVISISSKDSHGQELSLFDYLLRMLDFNGYWTKG